jgi:hypothetical protein
VLRYLATVLLLGACSLTPPPPAACDAEARERLGDDPERFLQDADYRRLVLSCDLVSTESQYAAARHAKYAIPGPGWDALPERNRPSRALALSDEAVLSAGRALEEGALAVLPEDIPSDDDAWIALGRRVFFEYPLRVEPTYEAVAKEGALQRVGFLTDGGVYVGLRVFDEGGALRVGQTCAQCHASVDEAGAVSAVRANRAMDIGAAHIIAAGYKPGALPPELDSTTLQDADRLGPGRADLLDDGLFNPYAFPDFGGLGDMPLLHHNGNWRQDGAATLAVRCETLFITSNLESSRPPRVFTWALSRFFRRSEAAGWPLGALTRLAREEGTDHGDT